MNLSEDDPDPIQSVRTDIEVTRAVLVETVNELSDRPDPTKQVAPVAQGVTESTKHVVGQAADLTKDTADKADGAMKAGVTRGRQLSDGKERQLLAVAVLAIGLLAGLCLWRRRQ